MVACCELLIFGLCCIIRIKNRLNPCLFVSNYVSFGLLSFSVELYLTSRMKKTFSFNTLTHQRKILFSKFGGTVTANFQVYTSDTADSEKKVGTAFSFNIIRQFSPLAAILKKLLKKFWKFKVDYFNKSNETKPLVDSGILILYDIKSITIQKIIFNFVFSVDIIFPLPTFNNSSK